MNPSRRMSQEDACKLLKQGKYGVLSLAGKEGTPYGIPLNYFYVPEERSIYFHCFIKGRKMDYMKENNRVSFVVIGGEKIVPEKFVTHYDSVMVTGEASFITNKEEKIKRLLQLCQVLAPEAVERRDEVIEKQLPAVAIVKLLLRK